MCVCCFGVSKTKKKVVVVVGVPRRFALHCSDASTFLSSDVHSPRYRTSHPSSPTLRSRLFPFSLSSSSLRKVSFLPPYSLSLSPLSRLVSVSSWLFFAWQFLFFRSSLLHFNTNILTFPSPPSRLPSSLFFLQRTSFAPGTSFLPPPNHHQPSSPLNRMKPPSDAQELSTKTTRWSTFLGTQILRA